MKLIKALFITLLILISMPVISFGMEEARAKATKEWDKEKPKYPNDDLQRDELAKQKAELETTIEREKQEKNKTKEQEDELNLNEYKLQYYDAVINQFDFSEKYHETGNIEDQQKEKAAVAEQAKLDAIIIARTAEQIQSGFNPSDGGGKTTIINQVIKSLQKKVWKPLKDAIDSYTRKATTRELSVKQAKKSLDKTQKKIEKEFTKNKKPADGTQPPPAITLPLKSLGEQLNLWEYTYTKPDNLNSESHYEQFASNYINNAINDDVTFTIQHQKDPKSIEEHHQEVIDRLSALGVEDAQINKLAIDKDNAVKKITAEFNTPEAKKQITDFFNSQSIGDFTITTYEKLADETSKLKVKNADDLQKLKDNTAQLRSTVDALNNYATYALDQLPLKAQSQLLEFLQDQQINLASYYDNISLSPYLKSEELMTIISDATTIQKDLEATQQRIVANAEAARIKNEPRREVQQLENQKGIKPLDDAYIALANTGVPNAGSEFAQLLVDKKPLDATVKEKFDALTRGINSFVENAGTVDPSKKAINASEIILTEINDLQDYIQLYNNATELTEGERKQLVQYYKTLDQLYTKVATQGIKDMNNLLKTLGDGTIIYLDQSKRAAPSQEFIKNFSRQSDPNIIEAWFKAGRLDMTTSEDISQ